MTLHNSKIGVEWSALALSKFVCVFSILALAFLSLGSGAALRAQASAQASPIDERQIHSFVQGLGIGNPVGLAFIPGANAFLVLEPVTQPELAAGAIEVFLVPPAEDPIRSRGIDVAVTNPVNVAYDHKTAHLLILDAESKELIEFRMGPEGLPNAEATERVDVQQFGIVDAQGMAIDPNSGDLLIVDAARGLMLRVAPSTDAGLTGAAAWGAGHVSVVDLWAAGLEDMHGLAINPVDGHYFVLSPATEELYELTQAGKIVEVWTLAELQLDNPQGMAFGPSADQTDDPARMNLYLLNSSIGKAGRQEPESNQPAGDMRSGRGNGQIIEFSFELAKIASASTVQAALLQTIDTSQFSPPSPDPAGIAYIPSINSLMFSDAEVDEMPIFEGANVFRATLSGTLLDTHSTLSFSREPNGLAYNPANDHLFVSDDTSKLIFEVDPESDGLYFSEDDLVTYFSTRPFQSLNPEDVAYDPEQGHLFVLDQTNREVYEISPGTNGLFDGVSPPGDDYVTNFDIERWGSIRPQGIYFDPESGHLLIAGTPSNQLIEVTKAGTFVRSINIAAASARLPAGITFAPSSADPAQTSAYITERGLDNNAHPEENDGKIYEMTWPPLPPDSRLFSVDAGQDQLISLPENSVDLAGTLTRDEPSDQPETMVTLWIQLKGPEPVSFADAAALHTTVTFPTHGVFVLRLVAAEGDLFAQDTVSVTINPINSPPQVYLGLTQVITLAQTATLQGAVIDDGLPNPPAAITHQWNVHYGPSEAVTIGDAKALNTTANFSRPGAYILRLTADDGQLLGVDDVAIVVLQSGEDLPGGNSIFIPHVSN